MTSESTLAAFIDRWSASGGNELANAQPFLKELCEVLDLPRHEPAKPVNEENAYSFERKVHLPRGDGTFELKRLDLYKRGCFVLEAKQGQEIAAPTPLTLPMPGLKKSTAVKRGSRTWENEMARAKRQAEAYVRALPAGEGRPPFIIVTDVGNCFDLYAEFSCSGGIYIPYPDIRSRRIFLKDLADPEIQERFHRLWTDPLSLDPSRKAAKVTTEIAGYLANLAKSLEEDGHGPSLVASFLIRCLFSMFAEDVGLIPANCFKDLLDTAAASPELFAGMVQDLWNAMNKGEISLGLRQRLLRFNGNIFADPAVLPLSGPQIAILREAAKADWKEVEPAIFGTLLERALNPLDRQKLGAHYTPRAYVERLVLPTIISPLREDWHNVQAAAALLASQDKSRDAQALILKFHRRLCAVKVLDPACGSGNFLYVTLEHMKRLEGEVLAEAATYGQFQTPLEAKGLTVDPHQFLGLELNPRAAHITELVLWIGYLQWHFRTHGSVAPPEPIIKTFRNIENRDAVLAYQGKHTASDGKGNPITRWDGRTLKIDPVTGRDVPDETARIPELVYKNPCPAEWPEADFIVGNPPFIGNKVRRIALGSGYVDALSKAYPSLPESCDLVMYWWNKAAELVRAGKAHRFGLITTNSLTQIFNRRIVASQLEAAPPLSLVYAVPDHPWVDASDGAAVRIAMTVGEAGAFEGTLARVITEQTTEGTELHVTLAEKAGRIHADLTVGTDVSRAIPLKSNADIACRGVIPVGKSFIVTEAEAKSLGLGRISGIEQHIRPYRNGRDITDLPRLVLAIDLFGLTIEEVKGKFPEVYQWLFERVKPDRDQKRRESHKENWWIFAEPRATFRPGLIGLQRYIVTGQVAKHRFFTFIQTNILADDKLICIASEDAYYLGVLSSHIHVTWALAAGGNLGFGNDPVYSKTVCFDPFPFPDPTPELKARIRDIGERLDAHRKARQALHPDLTLTGMYNVLEAFRAGRELTDKERTINEQGLVAILRQLHDELDAAVAQAYGWPADLPEADILARLVDLNHVRAAEEKKGVVRWLRPEYQCRDKTAPQVQVKLDLGIPTKPEPKRGRKPKTPKARITPRTWPASLPEQFQAVRSTLASLGGSADALAVAKAYTRAPRSRIQDVLDTLASQGFIRMGEDGVYHLA